MGDYSRSRHASSAYDYDREHRRNVREQKEADKMKTEFLRSKMFATTDQAVMMALHGAGFVPADKATVDGQWTVWYEVPRIESTYLSFLRACFSVGCTTVPPYSGT